MVYDGLYVGKKQIHFWSLHQNTAENYFSIVKPSVISDDLSCRQLYYTSLLCVLQTRKYYVQCKPDSPNGCRYKNTDITLNYIIITRKKPSRLHAYSRKSNFEYCHVNCTPPTTHSWSMFIRCYSKALLIE